MANPNASAGQLLTGSSQNIVCNASTSTAAALPFGPQTQRIRVVATAPVNYRVDAGTPVAVATDALLGVKPEYITVAPGQRIAGIGNATINVTELDAAPLAPSWVLGADGIYASVDLNFVTNQGYNAGPSASAASMVTVSRGSTAMADDASGNWYSFAANVPRITNKGLLVEEARTQLLPNTVSTGWVANAGTLTLGQPSPANDTTAFSLTDTNGTSGAYGTYISNPPTFAATTTYAISFFVKTTNRFVFASFVSAAFASGAYADFDLQLGTATAGTTYGGGGWTFVSSSIQQYANGWWRISVMASNATSAIFYPYVGMIPSGTSLPTATYVGTGAVMNVWTPQVEAGTFPTSPIPNTSGASVTRAADVVKLTSAPVPTTALTSFAQGVSNAPATGPYQIALYIGDGTASNRMDIGKQNSAAQGMLLSTMASVAGGSWTSGGVMKIAGAVVSGSANAALNGNLLGLQATSGTFSNMTQTFIGEDGSSGFPFNGYLQRVALWAANRVSDAGLLALTSTPGILQGDGVQASVDLNFAANTGWNNGATGTAASMLTVSRGSPAYAQDASGNWIAFPASGTGPSPSAARITNQGLLVEEQRTNIVPNSTALNGAPWVPTGSAVGAPVLTAGQAAPDGTSNAVMMAIPAISGTGQFSSLNAPMTVATSTQYVSSVFLKGLKGGETIWISNTPDGVTYQRTQAVLTKSWQQFSVLSTTTTTTLYIVIGIDLRDNSQSAQPAQTVFVWQPQMEAGAFATSPILTTGGAQTRAADAITLTTIPTPTTYNPMAMVVYGQHIISNTAALPGLVYGGWGTANGFNDTLYLAGGNAQLNALSSTNSTLGNFNIGGSAGSVPTPFKIAGSAATNSSNFAVNGAAAPRNITGTPTGQPITQVTIGTAPWSPGSNIADAYITRFALIRNSVSDAGLVNLTHP